MIDMNVIVSILLFFKKSRNSKYNIDVQINKAYIVLIIIS